MAAAPTGSNVLVLYGLLDSPSLTAAFEFDLRPGSPTRITVTGELFARREVRKLALAPVSSMFWFGKTRRRAFYDFRPEVHDSDGLLVASATEASIIADVTCGTPSQYVALATLCQGFY